MWTAYIDNLLANKKKTVQALADEIGIGRRTLYYIRSGRQRPNETTKERLAKFEGVGIDELCLIVKGFAS